MVCYSSPQYCSIVLSQLSNSLLTLGAHAQRGLRYLYQFFSLHISLSLSVCSQWSVLYVRGIWTYLREKKVSWYWGLLISEVSWLLWCPDWRSVLFSKVSWFERCPDLDGYTSMAYETTKMMCPVYWGVLIPATVLWWGVVSGSCTSSTWYRDWCVSLLGRSVGSDCLLGGCVEDL